MNLGDLKTVLSVGINRPDLESLYVGWINRAVRKIQQDIDFRGVRSRPTITIPAGETSALLPPDFRKLTQERYPVYLSADSGGGPYPCDVVSREHATNLLAAAWPSSVNRTTGPYGVMVFLSMEDDFSGISSLNIIMPASTDLSFLVSMYKFVPPLEADDEENVITIEYEDAVESKLKAIAFAAINDPLAAQFEQLYRIRMVEASVDDFRRFTGGRVIRMGGY